MTDLPPYSRTPVTLPDGTPVIGWSGPTPPAAPHCRCSHPKGTHYRDRKGRDLCGSAACGCAVYRPKETAQ